MLLLDSHALLWLVRGDPMSRAALDAITAAQSDDRLYAFAITAWELGGAVRKRERPPDLRIGADAWFRRALRLTGARLATITLAIAAEAARVPAVFGRNDPGDCLLIATAHVRGLALVIRDGPIRQLAAGHPSCLAAIAC
ncbi:MAG: PIN domain-containing protein [Acetobacteraceae bacterium]